MHEFNAYYFIIGASMVLIISYLFNLLSKRTGVPSVLMLIALGVILKYSFDLFQVKLISQLQLFNVLEVVGTVGLIMIVLEAAMDLELKRDKIGVILKSSLIALVGLLSCVFGIAFVLNAVLEMNWTQSIVYATPLSIISSAVVIPSIGNLVDSKKEFLIYESSISDILGIMFFFFFIKNIGAENTGQVVVNIFGNISLTVIISVAISYALIILFQKISSHNRLFLLLSILLALYSLEKLSGLSSLLLILFFGLIINNHNLFFRGFLRNWIDVEKVKDIFDDLKLMTAETAFMVRTFFFVIFGISISLGSLLDVKVVLISVTVLLIIFLSRIISFGLIVRKDISPQAYIAPRGLITILLFFSIPADLQIAAFDSGILLFVIIVSGFVMTGALIRDAKRRNNKDEEGELPAEPNDEDFEVSDEIGDEEYLDLSQ